MLGHRDAARKVELGLVETQAQRNITQRCCCKKERERHGHWCDDDQTKHAKPRPEHYPDMQCARNQAGNPTAYRAEPVLAEIVAPCDHRRNHTRPRARRTPCLPAGDQQFCALDSRQAGVAALRRALWRSRWMAMSASNGRGQGRACRLAFARSHPGIQVASMSRRCLAEPWRAIQ